MLLSLLFFGCLEKTRPAQTPSTQNFQINLYSSFSNPKNNLSNYYTEPALSFSPSPLTYSLPLDALEIPNFGNISTQFSLSNEEKNKLLENALLFKNFGGDSFASAYKQLKKDGVPIFITSDSMLHTYHVFFDYTLKTVEEKEFYPDITQISRAMMQNALKQENELSGDSKKAAHLSAAFFAVALKLLDENAQIPEELKDEVSKETSLINAHQSFAKSPIFHYKEDYSQYVPRGHYTQSKKLKKYFKAMMWFGRMSFLLKGGAQTFLSGGDAKIQTSAALLIANSLNSVKVGNTTAGSKWSRVYAVTSFFVGLADDLTPLEYNNATMSAIGSRITADDLDNVGELRKIKEILATLRSPKIYGGTGKCEVQPPLSDEQLNKCLENTKGMRFMGQRFVPDSYMEQKLVAPSVGFYTGNDSPFTLVQSEGGPIRGFPRGLDIMSILSSEEAEKILKEEGDAEYANYSAKLNELKNEFSKLSKKEWHRNLYLSWLYTLRKLFLDYSNYPTFMRTEAWRKKELNTALGSWAQLRHDTILYAKQSYTVGITSVKSPSIIETKGYVEPVPEFYNALYALTDTSEKGFVAMDVINKSERMRFDNLKNTLERLREISIEELEGKELSDEDYNFIRNFGETLSSLSANLNNNATRTTIVADVHTDTNSEKVLEEGTGYIRVILVAYKLPDGKIIVGAGPVFSYYEFKQPMSNRLTDEEWIKMLQNNPPQLPDWLP